MLRALGSRYTEGVHMGTAVADEVREVARKPAKGKGAEKPPRQFNIRLDGETAERVESAADALGLDGANFLRQMVRECLPIYERRAQQVRDRRPPVE
jgi:hypothetical protein